MSLRLARVPLAILVALLGAPSPGHAGRSPLDELDWPAASPRELVRRFRAATRIESGTRLGSRLPAGEVCVFQPGVAIVPAPGPWSDPSSPPHHAPWRCLSPIGRPSLVDDLRLGPGAGPFREGAVLRATNWFRFPERFFPLEPESLPRPPPNRPSRLDAYLLGRISQAGDHAPEDLIDLEVNAAALLAPASRRVVAILLPSPSPLGPADRRRLAMLKGREVPFRVTLRAPGSRSSRGDFRSEERYLRVRDLIRALKEALPRLETEILGTDSHPHLPDDALVVQGPCRRIEVAVHDLYPEGEDPEAPPRLATALLDAIDASLEAEAPVAEVWLAGQGTDGLADPGPAGHSRLAGLLAAAGFTVRRLPARPDPHDPPGSIMVLVGCTGIPPAVREQVALGLSRGGAALLLLGPEPPDRTLASLLLKRGLLLLENRAEEPEGPPDSSRPLRPFANRHHITDSLLEAGEQVELDEAMVLEYSPWAQVTSDVRTLLEGNHATWGETRPGRGPGALDGMDLLPPTSLAVAVSSRLGSNDGRSRSRAGEQRLVVVGSRSLARNDRLDAAPGNLRFLARAIDWLARSRLSDRETDDVGGSGGPEARASDAPDSREHPDRGRADGGR